MPSPPFRATDSPWFWGCLFSVMALVGMALIAPKYDVRQRQIEGRFLGRQQAHIERSRRAAGLEPVDLAETAEDRDAVAPERIVPLWTLATLAVLAATGSAVMLAREAFRASRQPQAPPQPVGPAVGPQTDQSATPRPAPTATDAMPALPPEASITPGNELPLVLHVGGVKTGSSAIQRDLTWDPIRPALDLGGLRYEYMAIAQGRLLRGPALSDAAACFSALYAFSGRLEELVNLPAADFATIRDTLLDLRRQGIVPILSYEGWLSDPAELIHRFTASLAMPLKVVAFVRDPVSALNSWYWERVAEIDQPIDAWIDEAFEMTGAWDGFLERWSTAPGVGAVDVRLVDAAATSTFCHTIGCEPPTTNGLHNRSFTAAMARFVSRCPQPPGYLSEMKFSWWRWVEAAGATAECEALGGLPLIFTDDQIGRIVASTTDANRRLLDRCPADVRQRIEGDPRWWSADPAIHRRPTPPPEPAESDKLLEVTLRALAAADLAWRKVSTDLRHASTRQQD
jgi:hypothetical protein